MQLAADNVADCSAFTKLLASSLAHTSLELKQMLKPGGCGSSCRFQQGPDVGRGGLLVVLKARLCPALLGVCAEK